LLVETDCPYLAPVPHRGKRNEPAFVADTAQCLATARGVSLGQLSEETSQNFTRLFFPA
jgi:TatD DNase family protein